MKKQCEGKNTKIIKKFPQPPFPISSIFSGVGSWISRKFQYQPKHEKEDSDDIIIKVCFF